MNPDAQLWIAVLALYVTHAISIVRAWRRNGNGRGDQRWNHRHAEMLAEHETQIALHQQTQEQHGKRLEVLGGRIHELANDMTAVLLKLEIKRNR